MPRTVGMAKNHLKTNGTELQSKTIFKTTLFSSASTSTPPVPIANLCPRDYNAHHSLLLTGEVVGSH